MAIVLYHNDMSVCAQTVRLTLEEKGLDYGQKHLNLRRGDQREPAYLKLNPNGLVPTLVHDDVVVVESVVINEYIDDAFEGVRLKPASASGRARMRFLTKQIDASIFQATAVVSISVAFHHQYTPDLIAKMAIENPAWTKRYESVRKGVDNPNFPEAIARLDKILGDLDKSLIGGDWLAGDTISLADCAYAPYVTRLDHLHFLGLLQDRPRLADWYKRMQSRPSYQKAITAWLNDKYLSLMAEKGDEAWPKVKSLLAA